MAWPLFLLVCAAFAAKIPVYEVDPGHAAGVDNPRHPGRITHEPPVVTQLDGEKGTLSFWWEADHQLRFLGTISIPPEQHTPVSGVLPPYNPDPACTFITYTDTVSHWIRIAAAPDGTAWVALSTLTGRVAQAPYNCTLSGKNGDWSTRLFHLDSRGVTEVGAVQDFATQLFYFPDGAAHTLLCEPGIGACTVLEVATGAMSRPFVASSLDCDWTATSEALWCVRPGVHARRWSLDGSQELSPVTAPLDYPRIRSVLADGDGLYVIANDGERSRMGRIGPDGTWTYSHKVLAVSGGLGRTPGGVPYVHRIEPERDVYAFLDPVTGEGPAFAVSGRLTRPDGNWICDYVLEGDATRPQLVIWCPGESAPLAATIHTLPAP
ncbi:MAG: hypothetical protein ABIO70_27485 [Pseudomonadota bacterium]